VQGKSIRKISKGIRFAILKIYLVTFTDMNVAEFIADQLYKAGIRFFFGVPGGPSIPYIEAFRNAGIRFILTSDEANAGIMADVSSRLTGIPGICHSTFGPGATNISTGIGGALLDRSSVIVFTSEMSDSMIRRTTQMNIDHQKLFGPITKVTYRLTAENADEVLTNALRVCREEYPGPVHIGLPSDISESDIIIKPRENFISTKDHREKNINEIVALLKVSRRPLLAAGLTARRLKIGNLLRDFLDKFRVPLVLTPMAKGLIGESHPSYTGVLFHALSDYLQDICQKCDLIIGIGYDPVEYNYESWIPRVPLIHFDTKESDMPDNINVVQFAGEPGEWFNVLNELNAGSLISEQSAIRYIRDEMQSVFEGFKGQFGPVAALNILRQQLSSDVIITVDVGSHLHLAGQFWETGRDGNFIISNGWSGMGFGIPAAIAATLVKPASRSVCITGDGGFLMAAGELMTARRYNLPVIVVVLSDGELNLIKLKQNWKDISPYGTSIYHGDLFGSDVFLGIKVLKADSHDSMNESVSHALQLKEPVIINAVIDPEDYKWMIVKQ